MQHSQCIENVVFTPNLLSLLLQRHQPVTSKHWEKEMFGIRSKQQTINNQRKIESDTRDTQVLVGPRQHHMSSITSTHLLTFSSTSRQLELQPFWLCGSIKSIKQPCPRLSFAQNLSHGSRVRFALIGGDCIHVSLNG